MRQEWPGIQLGRPQSSQDMCIVGKEKEGKRAAPENTDTV